jgi:hypothetical protein
MAYTTVDDASKYFQILTWTGNDSDNRALTNTGNSDLQPDILILKNRDATDSWYFGDTSALGYDGDLPHGGSTSPHNFFELEDGNARQDDDNVVVSLQSDGFTVGTDHMVNADTEKYIAYQWNITDGADITDDNTTNNDGDAASYIKKNTITKMVEGYYVGTGNANTQIGHGLGVKPGFIFIRALSRAENGRVYMTGAETANGGMQIWDDTSIVNDSNTLLYAKPDATDFATGTDLSVGGNGHSYFFWAFADVQGFSRSSFYTGNGASDNDPITDGPFVFTGFKPAFVMIKRADDTIDQWLIFDNKRAGYDPQVYRLYADSTSAETGSTSNTIQLASNGFKIRFHGGSMNANAVKYAYIAFAENPFVTSTGIPCTAQ